MIRTLTSSLLALALFASIPVFAAEPIPTANMTGGFAIGCQAYSFNRYTVFEAIEKTAEAGGKVIEFYPGQKLSVEEATVKWGHEAPMESRAKVKAKLAQHGIIAVAYGVVNIPNDEAGARKIFEFAKDMGIRVINTEATGSIDTMDKMVKEFDIKVGFHNHPKKEKDPNYKVWDPNYILSLVKDHDARIGACADTGHWQRSGLDPVESLRILKGHVVSSHLKDLAPGGDKNGKHDVPYGTGEGKLKETLDEMKSQGFTGPISVEYEYNWEKSVPEIKQCIDFVRAYGEKK